MASIKNRVENLEKKSGGDNSPYVGICWTAYPDKETAMAAWIAEHGEPKEGQSVLWVNFIKPGNAAGTE